jgi:hypothetical protein
MTAEQFTYWLQGYAELTLDRPTSEQWASIREHLATVFNKVTPPLNQHFPSPNWWVIPGFNQNTADKPSPVPLTSYC